MSHCLGGADGLGKGRFSLLGAGHFVEMDQTDPPKRERPYRVLAAMIRRTQYFCH